MTLLGPLLAPRSLSLRERDLKPLYEKHFDDRRKERQLFSTGSFFVTFATVRVITHAIRANRGPFRNITAGGRHIHHLTFGITSLLTVGYLWLLEIGTNEKRQASRITSMTRNWGRFWRTSCATSVAATA